ncbi:MAG: trigger factor [Gammaproteobacteria bacterium]
MPGFRPGKAPLKIIDAHYGAQVLQEAVGSLIESTLKEAFTQENLIPAGGPDVEPKSLERGKDLEYIASFDVYPEIKALDLKGVKIERPVCEITEEDIDRTIETMRRQRVRYEPVDRASKTGDQACIDFSGRVDGEPFPGSEAKDYKLVLGEGQFLETFEKGILGTAAGEQRTITVKFPADYHGKEVAGKEVDFYIQITEVAEPVLPEVNEDFIKSFGVEDGDVKSFRRVIADNLARERDDRISRLTRSKILDALVDRNELELPGKLVEREIEGMIAMNKSMLEQQGVPTDHFHPDREQYREDARRRVAMGLILSEIVRKNELKPDADKVEERIKKMAASYEQPEAFVQWYHSSRERMQQIESTVLEEQVVELLVEGTDIKEKKISLQELTDQASA